MYTDTAMVQAPEIAIVGAGMAGLTLASILHKHGIKTTIYEKDVSLSVREHLGGSLDLHEESGQLALISCGLEAQFREHSRPEGEEMYVIDHTGAVLWHDNGSQGQQGPPARPEIDRTVLRKLLVDSIPPESIQWDHGLVSVEPVGDEGKHVLKFSNGKQVTSDLVVGGDGAWSKVRPLLSSAKPTFTGYTGAEVSLSPSVVASRSDISEKIGQGTMACFGHTEGVSKTLISQRQGDNRIRTYAFHVREKDDFELPKQPELAKESLLKMYDGWAPWLRELVELADDAAIYFRSIYMLPIGHKWENKKGITLIGDAAHLMSPFAGEGANCAMQDGLELGLALINSSPDSWTSAIAAFEQVMCKRGEIAAAESDANAQLYKREDAAKIFAEQMASHGPPPE
ncbi:FAD/NAD(P)-binding domain-containing protein [Meredithblackwellia eburnea MCA 4105]